MLYLKQVSKQQRSGLFAKRRTVLKDISIEFESGKFYHIVGSIGSGKSCLSEIISGLIKPDSGERGWRDPNHAKVRIGYVPEDIVLPPLMRVGSCLQHYQSLQRSSEASTTKLWNAQTLMKRLGILEFSSSYLSQASVTVKRRLQFAVALIGEPKILILDEPFYGFDDHTRRESIALLKELKLKGSAIIALSGELREFDDLVDQKIILQQGRIVYRSDEATEAEPAVSSYELELSGLNHEMLTRLIEKRQLPAAQALFQSGYQQRLRFDDYERALLWLSASVSEGIVVTEFEEIQADLTTQINALTRKEESNA